VGGFWFYRKKVCVLWDISAVLVLVWLAGLLWGWTMGGFMYVVPVPGAFIITAIIIVQNHRATKKSSVRCKTGDPYSLKKYL
jgi:hypothetical protein